MHSSYFIIHFLTFFISAPIYSFQNRGNREVSACIHRYMERDFLAIESIVYPKKRSQSGACEQRDVTSQNRSPHIMMDGQELEGSCGHLFTVKECLMRELERSNEMGEFFVLRHLIFTINKLLVWLCGDGNSKNAYNATNIRSRFLVLLESIDCLECMRKSENSGCYVSTLAGTNLWNRILRMEQSPEVCQDLKYQFKCFIDYESLRNVCGERSEEIYQNVNKIFLENWCDKNFFQATTSKSTKSLSSMVIIFILTLLITPSVMYYL